MPGHALVKMTDLRAAFEAAGCEDMRSYIQSGNIVFEASDSQTLEHVRGQVNALIGGPAHVLFRTLQELDAIVATRPLDAFTADPKLKLYVAFLTEAPSRPVALPVVDTKELLEIIAVQGKEAYLVSRRKPNGMYGFPNNLVEKVLGVPATTRNWNTVTKLLAFVRDGR